MTDFVVYAVCVRVREIIPQASSFANKLCVKSHLGIDSYEAGPGNLVACEKS